MREAVDKLKAVIAKKDIIPLLTHYIAQGGFIHASDGRVSAGVRVEHGEEFAVRGQEFQTFLSRVEGEIKITVLDNFFVKVSCGRYRATIPGIKILEGTTSFMVPSGKLIKLKTQEFVSKLRAIRPFLSDNATQAWAACASFTGNDIFATNNVVIVKAIGTGLVNAALMMPFEIIDYVISNSEGLDSLIYDDRAAAFIWKDKSWVKSSLREGKFPNTEAIFAELPPPKTLITDEWREAYLCVAGMCEGEIRIYKDRILGDIRDSETEAEIKCPFAIPEDREYVAFNEKYFTPVVESATHMHFFIQNGPRASFKSEHLIGVTAGMGR